jgi:hypothetical protein
MLGGRRVCVFIERFAGAHPSPSPPRADVVKQESGPRSMHPVEMLQCSVSRAADVSPQIDSFRRIG